jgi:hypothetical protein
MKMLGMMYEFYVRLSFVGFQTGIVGYVWVERPDLGSFSLRVSTMVSSTLPFRLSRSAWLRPFLYPLLIPASARIPALVFL